MKVFVARQPIFDKKGQNVAYELLYRNGDKSNTFPNIDGDEATTDVIVNSFINIGLEELSQGKKCFINFTESLLQMKLPSYFNPSSIVVEILEDVPVTEELVSICRDLKKQGYTIALDDFNVVQNNLLLNRLLAYIDIIKVDLLQTSPAARKEIIERYKPFGVSFLAEKVETHDEYEQAVRDGYDYFQGYFFSKPVVLSSYDIPIYIQAYLQILHELSKTEPDIDTITEQIEQDLSLSYKTAQTH
ncbi:EAL domain-containing protein [Metabacillus sp. cB07]|uniref:EAL and HDOD domain-containing protein n=1 Tax=Metabacillus sp. cB07 TaxID=2806989 RepID=UPI002413EDCD|nr:EAL domain-containing protein [Metabacillus sp. cB07]